jgi:hypothetical protein
MTAGEPQLPVDLKRLGNVLTAVLVKALAAERRSKGMRQSVPAQWTACDERQIRRYETLKSDPPLSRFALWAHSLNFEIVLRKKSSPPDWPDLDASTVDPLITPEQGVSTRTPRARR